MQGRGYAYDGCGRPFTCLPAQFTGLDHEGLVCVLDLTIKLITDKVVKEQVCPPHESAMHIL